MILTAVGDLRRSMKMEVNRKSVVKLGLFFIVLSSSCKRDTELVFQAGGEEVVVWRDGEIITYEEFESYIEEPRNSDVTVVIQDRNEKLGTMSATEMRAALERAERAASLDKSSPGETGGEFIEVHIGDFNYGKWPPD